MKFLNQKTDLTSSQTFKKSILGLVVTFICALFAAGCSGGSSGSDFVATPGANAGAGGGGAAGSGSVTFNFTRAQEVITVPLSTVSLRFEFFAGLEGTGTIVKSQTEPYADTITINNVPVTAQSVVVTAITAEGFPLAEFTANVTVPANGNTTVNASDGNLVPVTVSAVTSSPVNLSLAAGGSVQLTIQLTFSNGDTVLLEDALASEVTFTSSNLSVATVGPDGTVTGVGNGSATITASIVDYPGQEVFVTVQVGTGVGPPPVVTTLTISGVPDPVSLPVGTVSAPLVVTAVYDSTGPQVVTQADGVVFTSTSPTVSVDSEGRIAIDASAQANTTATITAKFKDAIDTVSVQVNAATLTSLTIDPPSVSLPFGGFEQSLTVTGSFSDGSAVPLNASSLDFVEDPTTDRYSVDTSTGTGTVISNGTNVGAGTSNLRITEGISGNSIQGTVSVAVGLVTVNSLTITPQPVTLVRGEVQEFSVKANLSDGSVVDVSDFAALMVSVTQAPGSGGDTDIVANGKQVVAVSSTPDGETATATFTMNGAGPGGAAVSANVQVTVLSEFLVSARYFYAGNEVPTNNTVNLPRGYVGVFEVEGTFNTGAVRRLRASEYTLVPEAVPNGNNGELLELFDDTYATSGIAPVQPRFEDGEPTLGTWGGVSADHFNDETAEVDDLYAFQRDIQLATPSNPGTTGTTVRVRPTFRAVVADWRRNEGVAQSEIIAPNSQRFFTITINSSIDNPDNPGALDQAISVTITDPDKVELVRANSGFVNYPSDNFVVLNAVREFDVRVNFRDAGVVPGEGKNDADPDSLPPAVEDQLNFRLAEANAGLGSNGFRTVPTELGFPAVTRSVEVDVALLYAFPEPVGGISARPIAISSPAVNMGAYEPGEYLVAFDTFGPSTPLEAKENPAQLNPGTDPGPAPALMQTATDRQSAAPPDILDLTDSAPVIPFGIDVVTPILFSVDPINPMGATIDIGVGASQLFRTLVRFQADEPIVDRSLDYSPTLFVGASPAAVGTYEEGNTAAPGRLIVSGVNDAGDPVTAADVLAQGGTTNVTSNTAVMTALGTMPEAIVVAIDAVGIPIVPQGMFNANNGFDLRGNAGDGQEVVTIEVTP